MPLTVRTATRDDAELIADLSIQTFVDTYAAWNTPANMDKFLQQQFTRERLIAEVGAPGNEFFLVCEGDEPVGYLKLREGRSLQNLDGKQTLEIARLYTRKDKIGKGVGKTLMQTAVQRAKAKGKNALWLAVWKENHRAIRFYEAWGFEKCGEWEFWLGNDRQEDWLMKKLISG